jgi:hypothetical protein
MNNVKYDIIKTKDPEVIKFIIPLASKLIEKNKYDYSIEDFSKWCRGNIVNPACGFWICTKKSGNNRFLKEEKKIVGYLVAVMMTFIENEQVFIYHLYSEEKKVTKNLFDTVEKWAKDNGIKKLSALVKRPKGMCKLFNAKYDSTMIVKEI